MQSPGFEVVISYEGEELAREAVETGSYTFGSSPACEFYVDAPRISPRHFQITIENDGTLFLKNLPTPAGTFLDGMQITEPTPFRPGQEIAMGDVKIEFRGSNFVQSPAAASPAKSTPHPVHSDENQGGAKGKKPVAPTAQGQAGPAASRKEVAGPKKKKISSRKPSPSSSRTLYVIALAGLLVILISVAVFAKRTADERDQALLERDRADAARRSAETARHAAESARQKAETARQAAETARQSAEEALKSAEAAKQEDQALISSLQNDLLKTYTVLGRTMLALGDAEGQVSALTKATEVGSALMKSNPKDVEAARLTGEAYANIGAAFFRQKNLKEARPMFERYLEIIGQLAKEMPDNYQYQVNAAEARIKMVSCEDLTTKEGTEDFVTATKDGVEVLEKLQQKGGLQPPEETTLKMYRDALKEMGAN